MKMSALLRRVYPWKDAGIAFGVQLLTGLLDVFALKPNQEVKRVCFAPSYRMKGIGDHVMYISIIHIARERYPNAEFVLLLQHYESVKYLEGFYLKHSDIERVIFYPKKRGEWPGFISAIRKEHFDLCLGFQNRLRELLGFVAFGIPKRIGFSRQAVAPNLLHETPAIRDLHHWVDYAMAYAHCLGIERAPAEIPYFKYTKESLDVFWGGEPVVALHVGGGLIWDRRWPIKNYEAIALRLCQELGATVLLVGSEEESRENDMLREHVLQRFPSAQIHNLCGGSINKSANYLERADLMICNDSGPMHIAVALNTPVIAIFGPSNPLLVGPQRIDPKRFSFITSFLDCQPCDAFTCARKAIGEELRCMKDISVERVWRLVLKRITIFRKTNTNQRVEQELS